MVKESSKPLGLPNDGFAEAGYDTSVLARGVPEYPEVLKARAGRVAMVREFLAGLEPDKLGGSDAEPVEPGPQREHVVLPARDPVRGVGTSPFCRARP